MNSSKGSESLPEKLVAYALDWHLTGSMAFEPLLIEPLAERVPIELRAWDGGHLPEPLESGRPTIFCMLPPPAEVLATSGAPIVWIPMWDHARIYEQDWWDELPRNLRVVAFSGPVRRRAEAAGLDAISLEFFLDPAQLPRADWDGDRVAFYWNRTGLLSRAALERLCRGLGVSKLLFRSRLDPRIPERLHYELPPRIGKTEVVTIDPRGRDEYIEVTSAANLVVAPRACEGVGLTFLEGMARGCCVLGFDAPTMNEYIRDGENGLLFKSRFSRLHPAALVRLARRSPHLVNVDQPWRRLSAVDHRSLGERAREDHVTGHCRWVEAIPGYARFLLDW
jgi:glycosyltransferase involved in cell wall biosynthesis